MKVVHSWLKEYVGETLPSPEKVEELLTFHSFEVEGIEQVGDESVIDVDVLPNRASDCLCHRGIARELASLLDIDLEHDPLATKPELTSTDKIHVDIQNEAECPRFTASLFTGVTVGDSPEWLKKRLKAIGVRSINNVVDATNYVMFALGEPVHAYDADLFPQVDGKWQFVVRQATEGEKVSLLSEGGKEEDRVIECVGSELLIVDGSSNTPIGMAGVKGGRFAGVHAGTKNIIIEAAHFNPISTRKTARRLGIVIDASKRFENEPSRDLPPYAQAEIAKLMADVAGGVFEGYVDKFVEEKNNPEVVVTTAKTNALLGLALEDVEVTALLQRIGAVVIEEDGYCKATGPFERTDLNIEEDFIEEVGRLYGLDNIVSVIPDAVPLVDVNKRQFYSDEVRSKLTNLGFSEVITSSFRKKGDIQLQNALASDKSYVRGDLQRSIVEVLDKNIAHTDLLGISGVRVFELGTVFIRSEGIVSEYVSLAIGVRLKGNGYSPADDKEINTVVGLLAETGFVSGWSIEKGVAETNLSNFVDSAPVPTNYVVYSKKPNVAYSPVSVYPASSRDIALWVGDTEEAEVVVSKLVDAAGPLLVKHTLFDTFSKEGRTSYAFRLVFQSFDRTLTDVEVSDAMESVYTVAKESGWEVR